MIEIIPGRLYWVAHRKQPESNTTREVVNIDNKFVYKKFNQDFGPLNLGMMNDYIKYIN